MLSNYGLSLKIALYVAVVFLAAAGVVALRCHRAGRPATKPVARVLAVGSMIVVVIATALPRDWPPRFARGDLVLELGRGGLADWRVLYENPNSLAAVLLLANVLLYIPLALFGVVGWPRHGFLVWTGCVALSLGVELSQRAFLDGVASTDDVILNVSGATVGALAGAVIVARGRARRRAMSASLAG